jgi:hypothetical protein
MTMSWLVSTTVASGQRPNPWGFAIRHGKVITACALRTQIFVILLLRAMDQYRGARSIIHGPAATFVA